MNRFFFFLKKNSGWKVLVLPGHERASLKHIFWIYKSEFRTSVWIFHKLPWNLKFPDFTGILNIKFLNFLQIFSPSSFKMISHSKLLLAKSCEPSLLNWKNAMFRPEEKVQGSTVKFTDFYKCSLTFQTIVTLL